MKNILFALLVVLLLSSLLTAHGNLEHILGTVVEVTDHSISVKTSDGATIVVAFDAETRFLKAGSPASIKDVVVGARVAIHAHKNGDKFHAAEIKIGASPQKAGAPRSNGASEGRKLALTRVAGNVFAAVVSRQPFAA